MNLREARTKRSPGGRTFLLGLGRVQRRHELVNFDRHHGEHRDRLVADGRESVHRAGRNLDVLTLMKVSARAADQYLKAARQDAECFVRLVMDMGRSLVTRIWFQVPSPKDEVRHEFEITTGRPNRFDAYEPICVRRGPWMNPVWDLPVTVTAA